MWQIKIHISKWSKGSPMNRCECLLEESIGCIVHNTYWSMNTYLGKLFKVNGIDLTAEQFKVMLFLWKKEFGSQQDIADLLGKDKTTITRLLEGLEKRGFILRQADKIDKRSKRVIATKAGKLLEEIVMPLIIQSSERITSQFTSQEIEITKKVLKSLCELHHDIHFVK